MKNSDNNSRRSFLKKSAIAAIGVGLAQTIKLDSLQASTSVSEYPFIMADGAFELPPLGYDYNALEPFIDATTMTIHHSKHHQTYVTKLNEALDKVPELKAKSLVDLITHINDMPEGIKNAIRNHGGGHFNHSFFWKLMSPMAKTSIMSEKVKTAIEAKWETVDNFKAEFNKSATSLFGSGWTWVVKDNDGALSIVNTPNQDNPVMDIAPQRGKPIMGVDVWEHAYYLKHQNKRADYLNDFWSVIDWNQVSVWYLAEKD